MSAVAISPLANDGATRELWATQFWVGTPPGSRLAKFQLNVKDAGLPKVESSSDVPLDDSPGAFDIRFFPSSGTKDAVVGGKAVVTGFRDGGISIVERGAEGHLNVADQVLALGKNPQRLAATDDYAYATLSDDDKIAWIRVRKLQGEDSYQHGVFDLHELKRPDGSACVSHVEQDPRLLGLSPSGIALRVQTPGSSKVRLFVALAAENAIQVIDLDEARLKDGDDGGATCAGMIPTAWFPTAVKVSGTDSRWLAVAAGKGLGYGPQPDVEYYPALMSGAVSLVDLDALDEQRLDALTKQVAANTRRPYEMRRYEPASCRFPVPVSAEAPTPIKHVILILRENKTYDFLLGDRPIPQPENATDPQSVTSEQCKDAAINAPVHIGGRTDLALETRQRWSKNGVHLLPNLHALADRFTSLDNFYDDAEVSMQGHAWATASFANNYLENIHLEDDYPFELDNGAKTSFTYEGAFAAGQPGFGNFFTHLMRHDVSFNIYGELIGVLGQAGEHFAIEHLDFSYPGKYINLDVSDQDRVEYLTSQLIDRNELPAFSLVLLPRDHTHGLKPGKLSPASMIAENDHATGYLIDKLSHNRDLWESTAVFVVEDDPQDGWDHVEYHRSICMVISPWAKPGYLDSVHASYPALFATIERILGLPPMNRLDATAQPMFDAFRSTPDYRPFDVRPREFGDIYNAEWAAPPAWIVAPEFGDDDDEVDGSPDMARQVWASMIDAPPPTPLLLEADRDEPRKRRTFRRMSELADQWAANHARSFNPER